MKRQFVSILVLSSQKCEKFFCTIWVIKYPNSKYKIIDKIKFTAIDKSSSILHANMKNSLTVSMKGFCFIFWRLRPQSYVYFEKKNNSKTIFAGLLVTKIMKTLQHVWEIKKMEISRKSNTKFICRLQLQFFKMPFFNFSFAMTANRLFTHITEHKSVLTNNVMCRFVIIPYILKPRPADSLKSKFVSVP